MNYIPNINLLYPRLQTPGGVATGGQARFIPGVQVAAYQPNLTASRVEPNQPLISRLLRQASMLVALLAIVLGLITAFPYALYTINPGLSNALTKILARPTVDFGDQLEATGDKALKVPYQPALDPTLPTQNSLVIDEIGINTMIGENTVENVEETLKQGVWRVPDFGTPFARKKPVILAAHRFGYLAWSNQFRRENSFYNLPKLDTGDRVEIIWNQRKYIYEIIDSSEGEQIANYQADLILYTCKFLESETRIFKYAKLIEV
jgi:sortase (surface protein transpeptidase)